MFAFSEFYSNNDHLSSSHCGARSSENQETVRYKLCLKKLLSACLGLFPGSWLPLCPWALSLLLLLDRGFHRGFGIWDFLSPLFFFFFLIIYLFMAVLGLRFWARVFSSCGKRGPLFIAVRGPLTIVASLVAEHRLQTRRLSNCGSRT